MTTTLFFRSMRRARRTRKRAAAAAIPPIANALVALRLMLRPPVVSPNRWRDHSDHRKTARVPNSKLMYCVADEAASKAFGPKTEYSRAESNSVLMRVVPYTLLRGHGRELHVAQRSHHVWRRLYGASPRPYGTTADCC